MSRGRPWTETAEEVEFFLSIGASESEMVMALGMERDSIYRALRGAGREDLWRRMPRSVERAA